MATKPDYESGTVTVAANGTTVTGVGSQWVSADITPGDMFGAAGYPMTRIVSVNSNTSLTIEPWRGVALTAAPYFVRYQPDGSRFTAAMRMLLESLLGGSVAALQAITGAADKITYFTGPGAMALADFKVFGRTLAGTALASDAYTALGEIPEAQLPDRIRDGGPTITDLNTFVRSGWAKFVGSTTNAPNVNAGFVFNLFYGTVGFNRQIAYERASNRQFSRWQNSGTWSAWEEVGGGALANPGWIKHPSGLIEQFGSTVVNLNASLSGTITLPIAFPNTHASFTMTNGDWASTAQRSAIPVVVTKGLSSVTIACAGAVTGNIRIEWVSKGY